MTTLLRLTQQQLKLITCGWVKCKSLINYIVKLYMTVRIHSKLKALNADVVLHQVTKRNRKAKKFLH